MLLCLAGFVALPGQKYNFTNLNVEEGLLQSQAMSLCQDQSRHLWIGTMGGLSRYNGRTFTHYTKLEGLPDNNVSVLLCDSRNRIWAGTHNGIAQFDGKTFKNYKLSEEPEANGVHDLVEDNEGTIWAAASWKLYRFQNGKFNPEKIGEGDSTFVTCISKSGQGAILASVFEKGIYSLSNGQWKQVITQPLQEEKFNVFDIFITTARDTLLATNMGLMKSVKGQVKLYGTSSLLQKPVYSIAEDAKGWIWLGTEVGAICIRPQSSLLTHRSLPVIHFTQKEGLTDNTVLQIMTDAEQNVWFASDIDGIFKYHDSRFSAYDETWGLANPSVMGIAERDSELFFATSNGGLFRMSDGRISQVPLPEKYRRMYCLESNEKGNLYIGTLTTGLVKYDRQGRQIPCLYKNQPLRRVNAIYSHPKDGTWVGNGFGLFRLHEDSDTLELKANLPLMDIRHYGEDTLLLGCIKGAYLFDIRRDTFYPLPYPEVMDASIICTAVDGDRIFLGAADKGLLIFSKSGNRLLNYTQSNGGLPSNFIYNLLLDEQPPAELSTLPLPPAADHHPPPQNSPGQATGRLTANVPRSPTLTKLWVGTGFGISCILLHHDFSIAKITNYDLADGLTGMESNHNASFKDREGNLWFGLTKGLFRFENTSGEEPVLVPPVITLKSVALFSQPISDESLFDSIEANIPVDLKLGPRQNHLTFELDGVWLRNPEKIFYKYKLEGLDPDYTFSRSPKVVYSSLPPGEYVFRAFAMTQDSLVSAKPVVFPFEIKTPFHQTVWFYLAAAGFLFLLGATLQYFRIRSREIRRRQLEELRIEEFNRLRKRTAEDFHDEMGNKLTRISVLSDILKMKLSGGQPEADKILEQIKENVGELYVGSKDIIWSLHPQHDDLLTLLGHIGETGERLFSETETEFEFINEVPSDEPVKISLDFSRNLQMIAKEVFNNALRHSQATKVTMEAKKLRNGAFSIAILDNGKGFDAKAAHAGNGLKNLRNRAERLGAELNIQSVQEKGTSIELVTKMI